MLRSWSRVPSPGINSLQVRPPGEGKAGKSWSLRNEQPRNGVEGLTWLGDRELRVLEALCDTILPGFEVATAENARVVVEEVRFTGRPLQESEDQRLVTIVPLAHTGCFQFGHSARIRCLQ